jgi:DNA-binding NtrC family response regulator
VSGDELRIVVVDDEAAQRQILADILRDEGHDVDVFESPVEALARVRRHAPDLVLTDLRMPQLDGHELLLEVRRENPELLVILMTAYATVESAVEAMKDGAFDYLQKPFGKEELLQRIRRAAERSALARENRGLRRRLGESAEARILGESEAIRTLRDQLRKVAAGSADVLLSGESGTGKELAARMIHDAGRRAAGPFVPVNCGAIPEALAESELFGHEKGAFTGAEAARAGRFEQADGGTLFLDEVGSMPAILQAKLLRVLQDRIVERVGGSAPKRVDVRIVAAANRDLRELVTEGRFRDDLFHRLNVVEVALPPLREHRDDIPLLVEHFRDAAADRSGVPAPELAAGLLDALRGYAFPGNVRELEHLVERMVVMSDGERLDVRDLPPAVTRAVRGARDGSEVPAWTGERRPEDLLADAPISLPEVEERLLREAVRLSGGNLSEAAKRLGISYKTMQYRARKFGIG